MRFRVVEGTTRTKEEYERFKDYYLHDFSRPMSKIREELGLTQSMGNKWSKRVRKETGFTRNCHDVRRVMNYNPNRLLNKNVKNYTKNSSGRFRVTKSLKGKVHYFGTYDTEDEAQRVVEWLRLHDWDKDSLKELVLSKS